MGLHGTPTCVYPYTQLAAAAPTAWMLEKASWGCTHTLTSRTRVHCPFTWAAQQCLFPPWVREQNQAIKESGQKERFKLGSASNAFKILILHRYSVAFCQTVTTLLVFCVLLTERRTNLVTTTDKGPWGALRGYTFTVQHSGPRLGTAIISGFLRPQAEPTTHLHGWRC